jgi:hypothetical protein
MLIVLICTISLYIQPSIKLNIHNQCLNVDLVSPIYITDYGLECYRAPTHKVYAGNIMRFGFVIYKLGKKSNGALIYKLQRRQSHESTEFCKNTSSTAQLLVAWRISKSKKLYADVLLIEHDKKT